MCCSLLVSAFLRLFLSVFCACMRNLRVGFAEFPVARRRAGRGCSVHNEQPPQPANHTHQETAPPTPGPTTVPSSPRPRAQTGVVAALVAASDRDRPTPQPTPTSMGRFHAPHTRTQCERSKREQTAARASTRPLPSNRSTQSIPATEGGGAAPMTRRHEIGACA